MGQWEQDTKRHHKPEDSVRDIGNHGYTGHKWDNWSLEDPKMERVESRIPNSCVQFNLWLTLGNMDTLGTKGVQRTWRTTKNREKWKLGSHWETEGHSKLGLEVWLQLESRQQWKLCWHVERNIKHLGETGNYELGRWKTRPQWEHEWHWRLGGQREFYRQWEVGGYWELWRSSGKKRETLGI